MVAIDHDSWGSSPGERSWSVVNLPFISAAVTSLLAAIAAAHHGFDASGLRDASQLAWRFAGGVFLVAMVAGPLERIFSIELFGRSGMRQRDLWLACCASQAVYLVVLAIPAWREGGVTETTMFILASTAALMFVAAAVSRKLTGLTDPARRTLLNIATAYFWICYSADAMYHLYGPHRPDHYYGACLILMIAALLLRFADNLVFTLRYDTRVTPHDAGAAIL